MRPSRGKRIVAPGTAASKPGSFGQHLVAPPPDRELGIVMAQSPELETAPAFSDSIIDAVRQPLVVLDEATCVVLANRAYYLAFNVEPGAVVGRPFANQFDRSEEHTSELQSLMRISSAVFCLKKKTE